MTHDCSYKQSRLVSFDIRDVWNGKPSTVMHFWLCHVVIRIQRKILEGSDHLTEAEWTSSCKIQFGCQGWCCYTCTKRMWMVPYLHIEALWRESRSDNSLRESRKSNWLEVLWWLVSGAGFVPVFFLCGTNLQAVPRARALKPPQVQDRGKKGVLWLESCQQS